MADGFFELYDRAMRAFDNGSVDVALIPATEAAKLEPRKWEPRLLLARIWLAQGGAARALADAQAAIALADGTMPVVDAQRAREVIALASIALKDLLAAEKALRGLSEEGHAPSLVRLLALLLDAKRGDEARDLAGGEGSRHPALAPALATLAGILDPAAPGGASETLLSLGELELDAALYDAALGRFQTVLSADPTSERAASGFRAARARTPRVKPGAAAAKDEREARLLPIVRMMMGVMASAMIVFAVVRAEVVVGMGLAPPFVIGGGFVLLLLALFAGRFQGKPT